MEHIDNRLLNHQIAVFVVTGTHKNEVGFAQSRFKGNKVRIANVGIGAEDPATFKMEHLTQLVGKRVAWVVAVSLERHPQDGGRPLR